MSSSLKNILSELKRLDDSNASSVYVPSTNSTTLYKPLTMQNQKLIIKAALDPTSTNIDYNISINKILSQLTSSPDDILVSDKPAVLLALRVANVGDVIKVEETDEEDEAHTVEVDLAKFIATYDTITSQLDVVYKKRVVYDNITVKIRVPTLDIDTRFLKECKLHVKRATLPENIGGNIGEMYMYEVAKFIDSIQYSTIAPETSAKVVNTVLFGSTDVKDCVSIVEMLPMTVNKQIIEFITAIRTVESKYATVDGVIVPLDASLFALD